MRSKILYFFILPFCFLSCWKPYPSFDTFSDSFEVDTYLILNDESLLVEGDGGYNTYAKKFGAYYKFYGLWIGNPESITCKGLMIPLDTTYLSSSSLPIILNQDGKISYIRDQKIDTNKVDSILSIYGFTKKFVFKDGLAYENREGNEIRLSKESQPVWEKRRLKIVRELVYYNRAPPQEPDTTSSSKNFFHN